MPTPRESPAELVQVARLAEERGIESIWLGEHSHLPVPTEHAFAADTPEFYRRVPDPYIVAAAIAASTNDIRIGTGISLPAEHNPLALAKALATLDQTSGGRFEWGVGYGWNQLEMVNNGLNPRLRMATFREVVLAVRELWTQDVAGYQGEHVSFTNCWSWPKPAQVPHPPILLGARAGRRTFDQLVEFCDGWLPSTTQSLSDIDETLPRLRRLWAEAGKDPAAMRLTFIDSGFWADVDTTKFRNKMRSTPETVSRLTELGADRLIVGMPLFRAHDAEPMLDVVAELIDVAT